MLKNINKVYKNLVIACTFVLIFIVGCSSNNTIDKVAETTKQNIIVETTAEKITKVPKYYQDDIIEKILLYYHGNAFSTDVWGDNGDYDIKKFHNISQIVEGNGYGIPYIKKVSDGKFIYNENSDSIDVDNIKFYTVNYDEYWEGKAYYTIKCNIKYQGNNYMISDGMVYKSLKNPPSEQDKRNDDHWIMDPMICTVPISALGYSELDLKESE